MWCTATLVFSLLVSNLAVANMPDYNAEPGLNPSRLYDQLVDFEKIDPFTGMLQLHHADISIPGNGALNLEVSRIYNSGSPFSAGEWTMDFGYVYQKSATQMCSYGLLLSNMSNPVLVLPDGSHHVLSDSDAPLSYLYITNQYWKATCAPNGNGLIVISPEGLIYEMTYRAGDVNTQKLYVTKITDRNGNWINISYDNTYTNGALINSVTASDGRSLTYSYSVDKYASGMPTGFKRLSTISDGVRIWSYGYIDSNTTGFSGLSIGQHLLNKVTLPDGSAWVYGYNGNLGNNAGSYKINSVTTPHGGLISYKYGQVSYNPGFVLSGYFPEHVITAKTISGATWTYSYVPGSMGGLDTTTVTAPNGLPIVVYKHFGVNTVANDEVWKIGLLAQKVTGTIQTETYTWTPLKISSQNNARSFPWTTKTDNDFNKALLSSKTTVRDGATYTITYSNHDVYGNPKKIVESGPNGGSRTANLTYNNTDAATKWVLHQVMNETVVGGRSTTRLFDSNHNLTAISVDGVTTGHTYNLGGTIASTTFPGIQTQGGVIQRPTHYYSNYKRGIPQSETQPESISITRVVSDAGTITSETNGRGIKVDYTYDGLNRPKTITYPTGHNAVSISYSATSKETTRGALVESSAYDGFGRSTSVTLGGIATTYRYDPLGRMIFKSNPGDVTGTSYTYDDLDRTKTITYADINIKNYTYGAATVAIKDERGNTTTYTYRAYGDPNQAYLMSIAAPVAAANVAITRNARDQVETVVQGEAKRTYGYNSNAYLSSVTDPETSLTAYGRDEAGSMTSRKVGTSGTTTYAYDLQNRLTYASFPAGTPSISQTYTKTHKLATVSSGATTRTFGYDETDNLISEELAIDTYKLKATYGYNANDQLSSITYPQSNRIVSFSPDVLGRPQSVSDFASAVTYWPSGQVRKITYQNGTVSEYGQNSRLWPSTFNTKKAGSTTSYLDNVYAYDKVGNLYTITDTVTPEFNRVFDYDAINRLTTINASGSWGTGAIAYDGKGNITSQQFGTSQITYAYSTQNKLNSVSGGLRSATFTYDSYGNILTDGGGKTYTYDDVPNLIGISNSNTGVTSAYVYDGLSKRAKVTKSAAATYEYHDSAGKLLLEYTPGTPNKLVEYIYLGNMRIAQCISDRY